MKTTTSNIHTGVHEADPTYGSVVPPIYLSSTFIVPDAKTGAERFAGRDDGLIYARFSSPTVRSLETRLAKLEGTDAAIATCSGMAAITLTAFHFLKAGDSVIAHRVLYGGTYDLFSRIMPEYGIKVHLIDCSKPEEIEKHIDNTTKMIFFETPTNPLLEVIDIRAVVKVAKKHSILTVLDGSFAPAPFQKSIELGVDIVIHSLTKYISGHSDLIAGAIIGKKELLQPMRKLFGVFGPTLSPFAAYLVMRGMPTLELRFKKQSEQALHIAQYLQKHPAVSKVYYPGLPDDAGHQIAKSQMSAYGSVLSFVLKDGYKAGEKMANSVKVFSLAVSLGSVESLIQHPASMTHAAIPKAERETSGIEDGLIRISVGLEDENDLIADLEQAMVL